MAKIHDKFVIELAEVIKGYGNDPSTEDPFHIPSFYRFYEIPNIAISENDFKQMKPMDEPERKKGKWIMDEDPHDGDCRCSVCLICIDAMHERNHRLLNALTGGKWWTFYNYCPNCGAEMGG